MDQPDVSILICTRNRAQSLRDTLAAIGKCDIPMGLKAEVVVIDNGSDDETAAVVAAADWGKLSAVRCLFEPIPGQSRARNRGITQSNGTIILFTDDDVRPHQQWIARMADLLLNRIADVVAGGVTFPPAWDDQIPDYARWWLAATDQLDPINPDRVVGANMGFNREVLHKVPGFDVELGPGALGFHDETLFSRQLLQAGYQIRNATDIPVEHHFERSRLTRQGLLEIAARIGRSDAYFNYHWLHLDQSWSLVYRAQLVAARIANALGYQRRGLEDSEAMLWQINRTKQRAYLQQYAIERVRRRNYERRGLAKLRGVGVAINEAVPAL